MSLRPDVRLPMLKAWSALGATVVVCAGILWWLSDPGDLPDQLDKAKKAAITGKVDLTVRITDSKAAVKHLEGTIEALKKASGFIPASEFTVPTNHPQPGQFFNERKAAVEDHLRELSHKRSLAYPGLGFDTTSKVPKNEDAPYLLAMLQLTDKAGSIILSTPTAIQSYRISQPIKYAEITGPDGRPPLLKEYALKLEVRGSLTDLLWIFHALAQVEKSGDYPLVIRRFTIDSKNAKPTDGIQQHDAVYEVAAMSFLSPEDRTKAVATPKRSGGLGGSNR